MKRISVRLTEGKNAKVQIEPKSGKVNAKKGAILRNRRFLEYRMKHIDKIACPRYYQQFINTSFDQDGEVVDKYNDFRDAADYS